MTHLDECADCRRQATKGLTEGLSDRTPVTDDRPAKSAPGPDLASSETTAGAGALEGVVIEGHTTFDEEMAAAGGEISGDSLRVWNHLAAGLSAPRGERAKGRTRIMVETPDRAPFDLAVASERARLADVLSVRHKDVCAGLTRAALVRLVDAYGATATGWLQRTMPAAAPAVRSAYVPVPEGAYQLPAPGSDWPDTAEHLLAQHFEGGLTIAAWAGKWLRWNGFAWDDLEDERFTDELRVILNAAVCYCPETGEFGKWNPTIGRINEAEAALRAVVRCDLCRPGYWRDGSDHGSVVAHRGGYLERVDGAWVNHEPSPYLFNLAAVTVPYEALEKSPPEWIEFLLSIFGDDADGIASIRLLQEWIGYLISGRTDLQVALQLLGPTRSGKGVIVRVITALMGLGTVGSTTLNELSKSFGLESLVGKSLIVVSDAKGATRAGDASPIERLLTIIGEDLVVVARKGKPSISARLPGRLMFAGNDVLALTDDAAALSARFKFLKTRHSFVNNEDRTLDARLTTPEVLIGIFSWAVEGLDRLDRNGGRFTDAGAAAAEIAEAFREQGSLTGQFVDEIMRPTDDPIPPLPFDEVYRAYVRWCAEQKLGPLSKAKLRASLRTVGVNVPRLGPKDGERPYFVPGHRLNSAPWYQATA